MNRSLASALAMCGLALAAACGGGGGGSHASVPPGPGTSSGTASGRVLLTIPAPATASDARKAQYVSAGANSATISLNGAGPTAYDLTAPSSFCAVNAGVRSCSLDIVAGSGALSVAVVLYANTTASGTALGSATGTTTVTAPTPFSVTIQINPNVTAVVASATFSTGLKTISYRQAAQNANAGQLVVAWQDASGTTIPVSDNSTFLTPITLTSSSPHITLNTTSVTSAQQGITISYDGSALVNPVESITINKGTTLLGTVNLRVAGYLFEFPTGSSSDQPQGLAVGPDGNIWFTEFHAGNIGRVTLPSPLPSPYTGSPAINEYPIASSSPGPFGIAADPNGGANMVFTEANGTSLGTIAVASPVTMQTPYPSTPDRGIIAYGNYLYLADQNANTLDMVNPGTNTRQAQSQQLGASCSPVWVVVGPDTNFWLTCTGEQNVYKVLSTNISLAPPTAVALPDYAADIATGADNALWLTETSLNKIGRLDVLNGNAITQFTVPTSAALPAGIVQGPDGAMWFAESAANKIGRIDISTHTITEFPLVQSGATPTKLIVGPDGWIWFSETGSGTIGRMQPAL